MLSTRGVVLLVIALLAVTAGVLFVVGQQACPPPAWAFWRFENGNFACVA